MKIDISKLSDDRELAFLEEWDAGVHDLDVSGWQYKGRLKLEAFIKKDSGLVKARVNLKAPLLLTCSRCQKDFESFLDKQLNLVYSIDLSKKVFELDDNIREELILSYPQKILCRQDCRGLCTRCGQDLNEGKCKCQART